MSENPNQSKPKQSKFKAWIGYPSDDGKREFRLLVEEMRFVLFLYIALILFYLLFYLVCLPFPAMYNAFFGNSFGVSVSASIFENLLMFSFLTLAVTIVSIKMSTKKPEDNIFDDRIRALMNSSKVENDDNIFSHLKNSISPLLAYNKLIKYDVYITKYFPDKKTYCFRTVRTQVTVNMCKDKDYDSKDSKINVTTDEPINGSYGSVFFLGEVHPDNFNNILGHTIKEEPQELIAGRNPFAYDTTVKKDSEFAIQLGYEVFSKVRPINDPEAWSFCKATKYCAKFRFTLHNSLKKDIKFELRRKNAVGIISDIAIAHILKPSIPFKHTTLLYLLPGDLLEFYIHEQ